MNESGSFPKNAPSARQPAAILPASELVVRLLERSSRQLTLAVGHSISLVAEALELAGEGSQKAEMRRHLFSAAATLKIEQNSRALRASTALASARAHTPIEVSMAVMGAHEQELHIAAIEICTKAIEVIDTAATSRNLSYDAFKDRSAQVLQTDGVDTTNPIGANMLAHAACSVFRGLTQELAADAILRKILVEQLTPAVVDVVSQSHREMIANQVLPNWQPRAQPSENAAIIEPRSDTLPNSEASIEPKSQAPVSAEFERALKAGKLAARSGERLGQAALANLPNPPDNLAHLPTLQPVVDIERDAVAFAHSVNVVPYSRESRRYYFGNARKRLAESGLPKGQLAAVDVVSALFDYVVDDKRLPESAKPLFWRLQQPSLALTLLDSAYLADEPRSLRRLIENFGAIVTAFPDDVARGSELFRRLETVIRAVEIVASSLQTRSAVMSRQVDLEFGKAANSITQLIEKVVRERHVLEQTPDRRNRRDFGRRPTRAQEISVTEKLQKLINDRLGQHDVPESAREFINQVWMRHLRTSVLRDGEDSQQYKVSLQVVDDLLWSLDNTKRSKTKLANRIPPLIRLLTQGMKEIGAKDEEYKPFFDEIFLMHLRKMQSSGAGLNGDLDVPTDAAYRNVVIPSAVVAMPPRVLEPEVPTLTAKIDTEAAPDTESNIRPSNVDTAAQHFPITDVNGLKTQAPNELTSEIANSPIKLPPELLEQAGIFRKPDARRRSTGPLAVDPPPVPTLKETVAAAETVQVPPTQEANPFVPSQTVVDNELSQRFPVTDLPQANTSPDQLRLLDVLNRLDLTDQPLTVSRSPLPVQRQLEQLAVGDWMEMVGRDGASNLAKVAWINHRRSVVLLVRAPDRKAQSLRIIDIETRLKEQRLFLVLKK
jgi:hypothetical protein